MDAEGASSAGPWLTKVCEKCQVVFPVKQMQPKQTLCEDCKPSEAEKSKKRRVAKAQRVANATAGAALEYHLKVGRDGNLASLYQDGLRDLVDTLVAMPSRPYYFDTIGAKYRELHLPLGDFGDFDGDERRYKYWNQITKRERPFHRLAEGLDMFKLVEDGLNVCRASATEYFGTIPCALHHVGLIYGKLGEAGVKGLGQPVHIDVQLPELVCFHYLLGGVATAVYKPRAKVTGAQQLEQMESITGYTLGDMVNSPPSRTHLTYHAATPLMRSDVLECMAPATPSGVVAPGDNLRVIGSWPHAGAPLTPDHPYRLLIFAVASPIRVKDPYKGYLQVLIGEPEVVWGALARTLEHRVVAQQAAFQALDRCAEHYLKHSIKIADGPLGKLKDALGQGQFDLATLQVGMQWLKSLKVFVADHHKLKKVWFVNELKLTSLEKDIKEALEKEGVVD